MKILSSLMLLLIFLTNTVKGQEQHKCSAKERFNNSYRAQNHKGVKSTTDYDVHYYKLDLAIENNSTYIDGVVTIGATALTQISTVEFELHSNFTIDSIFVQASKKSFSRSSAIVTVSLGTTLSASSLFNVEVYYHGTAPTGGGAAIGDGFSTNTSGSWGNSATWSLSEPYAAYEWFPVKQSLSDKADSSEFWITTDAKNMAGSNGVLENVTTMPLNKKRFEWKSRYPISYYLISVAVAEYVDYTIYAKPKGITDSIKVVNFIYDNPATLPNFKSEIDKTVDMLEVFSEKFGLYPFHEEKYGHCMAPFGGGMEHQTMTTQGYFFTDLTSHELGHQWFGDHVTCASWQDIWVNEGFASYAEYVYIEEAEPTRKVNWLASTENSALFSPTGSVYVDDTTNVSRIFNSSLSYNKGAYLLHMIRFEMDNDSLFFEGIKEYQQQYAMSNATGLNFKVVMENIAGRSFNLFFDQWYFGEGFPLFNINWNQDKLGNLDMIIDQVVSAFPVTPLFTMDLELTINRFLMPDTTIRVYIDQNSKEFEIPTVFGNINGITVDPNNWVIDAPGVVIMNPDLDLGVNSANGASGFKVYPNPARETISISTGEELIDAGVFIYDSRGSLVLERNHLSGMVLNVDVSALTNGAYVLELRQTDRSEKQPIVIGD